jgi:hypothetical protein
MDFRKKRRYYNYCQEQLIPRVGKEELLGLAQNFLTSISYLTLIGLFKF